MPDVHGPRTRRADQIGIWWTLLGPGGVLVTAFYAILNFFEPVARYGWAGIALGAIILALAAVLIFSVGAFAFGYLKSILSPRPAAAPSASLRATAGDPVERPPLTDEEIERIAHVVIDKLAPPSGDIASELEEIKERVLQIGDQVKNLAEISGTAAKNVGDVLGRRIQQISEQVDSIANGAAELEKKVARGYESLHQKLDWRFDAVDQSFRAIVNREWHVRLFAELAEEYEALTAPIKAGGSIDDPEAWRGAEKRWRSKLQQWLQIVRFYASGVENQIGIEDKDTYESDDWPFEEAQFANSTQVHVYKMLSISWAQAREAKARIDKCLEQAITSGSKAGRLEAAPSPD